MELITQRIYQHTIKPTDSFILNQLIDRKGVIMSNKIYIGNLSYDTSEQTLADLFMEYGNVVSSKIIEDKYTGRSKGFAFIEMEDESSAFSAINNLNGKELNGRTLKVNEAHDKPQRNNFRNNY